MITTIRKKTCKCGNVVVVRQETSTAGFRIWSQYVYLKNDDNYTGYFRNRRSGLAHWVYCITCNRKHEIDKMKVAWTLEEPGKELTF
jgi:hypothetical protein